MTRARSVGGRSQDSGGRPSWPAGASPALARRRLCGDLELRFGHAGIAQCFPIAGTEPKVIPAAFQQAALAGGHRAADVPRALQLPDRERGRGHGRDRLQRHDLPPQPPPS